MNSIASRITAAVDATKKLVPDHFRKTCESRGAENPCGSVVIDADWADRFGPLCDELTELTSCSTYKEWWDKFEKARNGQIVDGWSEDQHYRSKSVTLSVIKWVFRGSSYQLSILDYTASSLTLWQIDWWYEAMYGFEALIEFIEKTEAHIPPWVRPNEVIWVDHNYDKKLLEVIKDLNAEIKP